MNQIDLRSYPQNIQNAARRLQAELTAVSVAGERVRNAEGHFSRALNNAYKGGQITKMQEQVFVGIPMHILMQFAASGGLNREAIFIFGEEAGK